MAGDELGFMRAQPSPGKLTRQVRATALKTGKSALKLPMEGLRIKQMYWKSHQIHLIVLLGEKVKQQRRHGHEV